MFLGNLADGIMPRQLLPVILAFVFSSCAPNAFGWQDEIPKELVAYRQGFAEAAGSDLVASLPRAELLSRIEASKVLWLGDHHRHSRLHALQTELLEQLQQRGIQMAFGLEAVGVQDEPLIDDYLSNRCDLSTLSDRMRTRWSGSWLDDRDLDPWFYRSLLEFAKRHRIPVFALEPTPRLPLADRDPFIAQTVQQARERYRNKLVVVLIGQSHLLGIGDVVHRSTRVGTQFGMQLGTIIGGAPTERLQGASSDTLPRGACWRSDTDVLWFGEMFRSH